VTPSEAAVVSDNPFSVAAYRQFVASRGFSVLGIQIQSTTLVWQIYAVARAHHEPIRVAAFYIGLIGLVQFAPMLLLSLPAGELADRRDRRSILIASMLATAVCAALLVLLALEAASPIWSLLAVAGLFGCARAYIAPASSSLVPMLVPRPALARAIAINSMVFQVGTIAGPAAAGAILSAVSAAAGAHAGEVPPIALVIAYGASFALFLISALALVPIRIENPPPPTGSRLALIREGLAYVWRTKVLFGAISLDLVAVLLGGVTALLPAFASDILHVGAQGFGLLRSAPAVGALGMGLYLSRFHIKRHAGALMFGCVALFGAATIVFGVSQLFWLSLVALVVLGAADLVSVNIRQTLIQIVTPDHMRGRVSAVSMIFISASNEFGDFESGVVARFLGVVGAAVFGGAGSLVATGLWAWWFPSLRKADKLV
jgi:MFS family permease